MRVGILFLTIPWMPGFLQIPGTQQPSAEAGEELSLFEELPPESDPEALRIVESHIRSRGGREQLSKTLSMRREGRVREGKTEYRSTWQWSRLDGFREDRMREHLGRTHHSVRAFTESAQWKCELRPQSSRPAELSSAQGEAFRWENELYTGFLPFVYDSDNDPARHVFAYDGEGRFDGKTAHVVRSRFSDGRRATFYFSTTRFELLGVRFREPFADRQVMIEAVPSGTVQIDGLQLESGFDFRVGGTIYRRVRFERTTLNSHTSPAVFAKPEVREVWLRS